MISPIIGVSSNIKKIKRLIDQVAKAEVNTLVTGETGVGKELVVRHLYQNSKRNKKPFIKINCAALPETLIESELFGHKKGSFTGANNEGKGKFELANKGILFLDEIGDMPFSLQAKILHVLQDGCFTPIGSSECLKTNVWCIAATNRNIEKEIENGNFRQDLFYRLNTIEIHVEPLRNRQEDVPHLLNHFFGQYEKELNSNERIVLNSDKIKSLCLYGWPGNVRELQNYVKKQIILGEKTEKVEKSDIDREVVNSAIDLIDNFFEENHTSKNFDLKTIAKQAKAVAEKRIISYVLDQTNWHRIKTANILNISYKALLYKISQLHITPDLNKNAKVISFKKPINSKKNKNFKYVKDKRYSHKQIEKGDIIF
jgi:transcriptional regulator with PAS, ATPase and Fis domain